MKLNELEAKTNYGTVRMILNFSMYFMIGFFALIPLILAYLKAPLPFLWWFGVPMAYLVHKSALVLFDISDGVMLLNRRSGNEREPPEEDVYGKRRDGDVVDCPKCENSSSVWGPDEKDVYSCSDCDIYFELPASTNEN